VAQLGGIETACSWTDRLCIEHNEEEHGDLYSDCSWCFNL